MFKTVKEYATMLADLHFGRKDEALAEVFNAAKAYPNVPNSFWRDVFKYLEKMPPKIEWKVEEHPGCLWAVRKYEDGHEVSMVSIEGEMTKEDALKRGQYAIG